MLSWKESCGRRVIVCQSRIRRIVVGKWSETMFDQGSKRSWRNSRRWRLTKTIEIEIFGQRYAIKGDADEDYVRRLARFVDENMRSLAQGMRTATFSKLAVLAAINIAHQLFQSEQIREKGEADVDRRVLSLMESIEDLMPSTRHR